MTVVRWGLIAGLYLAGLVASLATFIAVLFSFLAGLSWLYLVIGAGLFGYAYACGETVKHLMAHDDYPWLGIGAVLVTMAIISPVLWKYAKL